MTTQHILNVITPAATQDLMTLDEFKTSLRIATSDTSKDDELTLIIDGVSAQCAKLCNRIFGFEKVDETFYDVVNIARLYFSRWPVKLSDIETFTVDGVDIRTDPSWVLEEKTGMLYKPGAVWNGDIDCIYSGGYKLPEDAPDDLKRVALLCAREDYYIYLRGAIMSGVRSVSHKHARVQFYPPGQIAMAAQTAKVGDLSPTWNQAMAVLNRYLRYWV